MQNYLKKKIQRLFVSKKIMKIFYFFHFLTGGFKAKKINISFDNKKKRQDIVQEIINLKNFKSYLEIGTFKDELFNYVKCEKKVGVDPVSGGTIRATSDQFFRDNKEKFDCVFIDGLHEYQQVKKDIVNSLKFLNENGVILLHDCLPNNYYEQATPRCQWIWNGDVWKAIVECRSIKDIDVYTCYADYGIGIIFKRTNRNLLDYFSKDYSKLKFEEYFHKNRKLMNIIEYDELMKIV